MARRARGVLLGCLLGAGVLPACSSGPGRITLQLYDSPDPSGATAQAAAKCSTNAYTISYDKLPNAADGQRQELVRRLAAHDSAMDLLALDVTWEAEFAQAKWIVPWTGAAAQQIEQNSLKGPLETGMWNGQLVAAPWTTNTQLLWYRADLVPKPPATWDEMIAAAESLAKSGKPHYIEEQGAQYEGLTVWFNSMVASAGGTILNSQGTAPTLGPPVTAALTVMGNMARSPAADPSLSNTEENDARLAMEAGNAAFEINYPFVWASMQKDKPSFYKSFKWAPFPKVVAGMPAKPTIGGLDLAVSAYSKHKDLDFQAAMCLRNEANQEQLAVVGGLPPTLRSLYSNPSPEFVKEYPFYKDILDELDTGSVRPKTPAYQNVSIVISHELSPPSSARPQQVGTLRSQIADAIASKGLVP
ncbi:MAG TPA: ABC transporter substrate-binding protein [Acidimicrobiales bacterium]|nr:ABC transporter substrate-binding protein [Acidimicrobiales bacterium]